MGILSLNEVMRKMVDDVVRRYDYGVLSHDSCLVWSMIGCPVVCDEVVCLKRDGNNNVYVLWLW